MIENKNIEVTENKNLEFKIKDRYIIIFFGILTFLFFREILLQQKFLWSDFIMQYYPFRNFAAVTFYKGIFPSWNPYMYGGMPFIADIQTAVFYPLHLLLTIFVTDDKLPFAALTYLHIFHYFMAGVFSYYLARSFDLSKWASILSGITFMFCGIMVAHAMHEPMIIQLAYMPLIFMFYNKSLSTSRPFEKGVPYENPSLNCVETSQTHLNNSGIIKLSTSKLKYTLLTGLFMGIAILCGHPQVTLYIFFTFLLFGLYQTFFKFKENNYKIDISLVRFIAIVAVPFVIGIMLGAIQLLPTMRLAELSERTLMSYKESLIGSLNYHNLITLFSPKFFGTFGALDPDEMKDFVNYWGHKEWNYLYCESCIYVGLPALIFGVFGIITLWKKRIVKFLAAISLFSILFSLGDNFIIYKFFYNFVPGFDNFRYIGRFAALILAFSFSLLGAYGFDYFIKNAESEKVKKFIKYFIILILCFVLLWVLYIVGLFENIDDAYKYKKVYNNSIVQLLKTIVILLSLFGLIILFKKKIIPQQVLFLLFILLSFTDFYIFGSQQNNTLLGPHIRYKNQHITKDIRQEYHRELYRIQSKITNQLKFFELNQELLEYVFTVDGYNPLRLKYRYPPFRTSELMNVKYTAVIIDSVRKSIGLKQNENYAPRVWMSYYPIVENSPNMVAGILRDTTFEIEKKVIIDQEPEIHINKSLMEGDMARNQIVVKSYEINEITILVGTTENGILVLSEVYYPNWKVFVDGVEKPILRCYYSLRGVALEKGSHTVVFKYVDKDFQLGAFITLFALAIIIGGFIVNSRYSQWILK
jgi:hypothetical protein